MASSLIFYYRLHYKILTTRFYSYRLPFKRAGARDLAASRTYKASSLRLQYQPEEDSREASSPYFHTYRSFTDLDPIIRPGGDSIDFDRLSASRGVRSSQARRHGEEEKEKNCCGSLTKLIAIANHAF